MADSSMDPAPDPKQGLSPAIIVGRLVLDLRMTGDTVPGSAVIRACAQCHEPVYIGPSGIAAERITAPRPAYVMCNPCAQEMVVRLRQEGKPIIAIESPESKEATARSAHAKANRDAFMRAAGKEP